MSHRMVIDESHASHGMDSDKSHIHHGWVTYGSYIVTYRSQMNHEIGYSFFVDGSQMSYKWVTCESYISHILEYNIFHLHTQTYHSLTPLQPCHTWDTKNIIFNQSEESNTVVSLTILLWVSQFGFWHIGFHISKLYNNNNNNSWNSLRWVQTYNVAR